MNLQETQRLASVRRVGVDAGFGDVKIAMIEGGELSTIAFSALLGRAEDRSTARVGLGAYRRRADVIGYDGRSYIIGDQAIVQSRLLSARQDAERIGSDEERILMLAALAKAGVSDVLVVTGLPVLWWDKRRRLTKSWVGTHKITWNGRAMEIIVREVRPVPQPFGSFYSRTLSLSGNATMAKRLMRSGWAILDVGLNTTDCAGILNLQPVARWCGGIRRGVRDVLDIVAQDIERKYGVRRPLHEIARALRFGGELEIYQDTYSLDGSARVAVGQLAQEIIAEAGRRWSQGDRFHSVLVTGGGAYLMGEEIVKAFPRNAEVLDRPALANAIGFAKYAQRKVFKQDRVRG